MQDVIFRFLKFCNFRIFELAQKVNPSSVTRPKAEIRFSVSEKCFRLSSAQIATVSNKNVCEHSYEVCGCLGSKERYPESPSACLGLQIVSGGASAPSLYPL